MNEGEDKLVALVAERFRKLKQEGFSAMESEEAVKTAAILPVLQELGWSVFDPKECKPEYGPSWKVDYALILKSKPRVFIEAKAVSSQLAPNYQQQLCNYTSQHGVPLAVLTNGKSWEFYLALSEGLFHERKVYSIEIEHQDTFDAANHMVKLLSRSRVASGEAEAYAKELHESHLRDAAINAALPEAWEKLFKEPDSVLMDCLAEEAEAISGFKPDAKRVKDFLKEVVKPPAPLPALPRQPASRETQERPGRVRGGITQRELMPLILAALLELGGSAHRDRVKEKVHERVRSQLTDVDYSETSGGGFIRWSHNCDWGRYTLVKNGFLKEKSPWGIWELTEEGTREAQRIADRLNRN